MRAGSILPRQPLVQSTMQVPQGPLQLDVYPGDNCQGTLYFDDGVHISGPSLRQTIECAVVPGGIALWFNARQGSWRPWWKQIAITVHGARETHMTIPDQPRANKIVIASAQ